MTENEFKIGDYVKIVSGAWKGLEGTIERWNWKLDDYSRVIESETRAEVKMRKEDVGKFAVKSIQVVCPKLTNITKIK
jgi:transcription antitermination factor NusG